MTITGQEVDTMQILQMKDEGVKEELQAPLVNTIANNDLLLGATKETRVHTIPDFLNRFHVLERFDWSLNDARGTVLKNYRFPDRLLAVASLRNKMANFYGLRAGVQLVVQVNSQPFQQGNLMVSYLPNARYNDPKRTTQNAPSVNAGTDIQGMVSRSGSPRVNLDLMDGTRVDLTVPYASPFLYYNLQNNVGTIGDFYISVYSQLRDVAANGTVSVTVAARFVDIELEFPMGVPLATAPVPIELQALSEAAEKFGQKPDRAQVAHLKEEAERLLAVVDAGDFKFQMNTAATAFKQKAVPHMATCNDDDLTHMLSTHSDSALKPLQMGNTSGDDMAFKEMLSIPCYHGMFTVNTATGPNTNVYVQNVTPMQAPDITNTDGSVSADYLFAVSNLFKKWRGSIKYKFRVVKTKYHSLRLRISFAPGALDATAVASIDRDSCYSEIFDLRDNNTCEFTVPYIHPYPWLDVKGVPTNNNERLGRILVDVHNQMVNPSTVSNDVEVIVERCAGPDFELAIPTSATYFPFDPRQAPNALVNDEVEKVGEDLSGLEFQSKSDLADALLKLESDGPKVRSTPNKLSLSRFESMSIINAAHVAAGVGGFFSNLKWYQCLPMVLGLDVIALALVDYTKGWLYKKDLTEEGIEPNPGPIYTTRSLISGTQSINFTSPYAGVQRIIINVGVVPQVNVIDAFDCMISSSVKPEQVTILPRCYTGVPFDCEFYWNSFEVPVLTVTGQSTGTHQNYVVIKFVTESPVAFQSNSEFKELPELEFQMKNFEQDMERGGINERAITQPALVTDMAQYCMGNQICHVKDMISRSTFYSSTLPVDSRPIHIMAHGYGIAQKQLNGTVLVDGTDNLSYFANFYAFARGGVNFRVQSTGAPYRVMVNTNNDINFTSTGQSYDLVSQIGDAFSQTEIVRLSNLMQHIINPSVEGIGEFSVPFYASSYCQSIDPERSYNVESNVTFFQIPDTHLIVVPQGQLSEFLVFRNANPDFQFSYLNGPPLLLPF